MVTAPGSRSTPASISAHVAGSVYDHGRAGVCAHRRSLWSRWPSAARSDAIARYAISLGLPTETGRFPWGTFVVNISGSFVLGFLLIILIQQFPEARLARPVIGTGFIGAYTTFSTFTVESVQLVRAGDPGTAVVYVGASLVVGMLAVFIGMAAARGLLRAEPRHQEEMR